MQYMILQNSWKADQITNWIRSYRLSKNRITIYDLQRYQNEQEFFVRKAAISDAEDIYYINKTSLGYDYDFENKSEKSKL